MVRREPLRVDVESATDGVDVGDERSFAPRDVVELHAAAPGAFRIALFDGFGDVAQGCGRFFGQFLVAGGAGHQVGRGEVKLVDTLGQAVVALSQCA